MTPPPWFPTPVATLLGLLALGTLACDGRVAGPMVDAGLARDGGDAGVMSDAGDAGDVGGPSGDEVPLGIAELTMTSSCTTVAENIRVAAVSPEGHLWLADSSSVALELVVLDAFPGAAPHRYRLPPAALTHLQAFSATVAMAIADGALLRIVDGERTLVSAPAAPNAAAITCGDLGDRALYWSDGHLYQRIEGEWWSHQGLQPIGAGARLLDRDGACEGAGDGVWWAALGTAQGLAFWLLTPGLLSNPALLPNGGGFGLRDDQLLALRDGRLYVGPEPWREVHFAHGSATSLQTAGAYAWVTAGGVLLRYDGAAWRKVVGVGPSAATQLFPYGAGGVWTRQGDQLCHHAPPVTLRLRGVRPGEQRRDPHLALEVEPSAAGTTLDLELDGVPTPWTRTSGGRYGLSTSLGVGWHRLRMKTSDGTAERHLEVKVLPTIVRRFAADIQPIYQTHCAGQQCHVSGSSGGAPDLSRYEHWVARAARLEARVVRTQDMPPSASRRPEWGPDEVQVINEWLNGGREP